MKNPSFVLKHVAIAVLLTFYSGLIAQPTQIIQVSPGFATVIDCPAEPELVSLGNANAFSVQTAGKYVLIKPLVPEGTTNMFLKAGEHSYNFLIKITDTPDLEVKLGPTVMPKNVQVEQPSAEVKPTDSTSVMAGIESALSNTRRVSKPKPLSKLSKSALAVLSSRFKATNRSTYSVNNSKIVFAVDHMKQIENKLYVIATIVNGSSIPFDIGYVQFKLIDYKNSYLFWRKRLKEAEMEPLDEYFNPVVKPNSSGRLLFVFEKHGFSDQSTLNIKCYEENGQRDLVLEIPGQEIE